MSKSLFYCGMTYRGRGHLLLGVLAGTTLLIGVVSVGLYSVFFPSHFSGWGEVTADQKIAGWVVNRAKPSERVEVQVYIDGRFVANRVANLLRPDVVVAGWAKDAACGYSFEIPPLAVGDHMAYVYAMHTVEANGYRTLQLTGAPLRFTVDESGRVRIPVK